MNVSEKIAHLFDEEVRERGRSYLTNAAVKIVQTRNGFVEANVKGSITYRVELLCDEDALVASCTCPHYEEGNFCKHIWATILTAEQQGEFPDIAEEHPFRLLSENDLFAVLDDDDDEDDEGFDDAVDESMTAFLETPTSGTGNSLTPEGNGNGKSKRGMSRAPQWRTLFTQLGQRARIQADAIRESLSHAGRELLYFIDVPTTLQQGALVLEVLQRELKADGKWGKPRNQRIPLAQIAHLPNVADRQILSLLVGAKEQSEWLVTSFDYATAPTRYRLSEPMLHAVLPLVCSTGRCHLRLEEEADLLETPLIWESEKWKFELEIGRSVSDEGHYQISGALRRSDERMPLATPIMLLAGGVMFTKATVTPLDDSGAFYWLGLLRQVGSFQVPLNEGLELLDKVLSLPDVPPLELPDELKFETVSDAPKRMLKVRPGDRQRGDTSSRMLRGTLAFDYGGTVLDAGLPKRGVFDAIHKRYVVRDVNSERDAAERLRQLGFRAEYNPQRRTTEFRISPNNLPRAVRLLVEDGWRVEAEGKLFRQPGKMFLEVKSNVDWFELHGRIDFGSATAHLPELLAAIRRGQNTVLLDDGSYGMLPEDWLEKYGFLVGLGSEEQDHLRFAKTQVGMLDALLAAQPEASFDAQFRRIREEICRFDGIEAMPEPQTFVGELRPYQREGVGWLHFLRRFGFGGCLADSMGLGKTAQTLALLESRRTQRETGYTNGAGVPPPSLVVAPRSLIFNWRQEAQKFTPRMRVLEHTGVERARSVEKFGDFDLILTTYGTLRRDAVMFKDFEFDYVILDEAQAIKNATSESAKAARLLKARHRLALSGTPVENHLGELWSLFEFLNPGMLGSSSVFQLTGAAARNPDPEARELLARGLRPFILRRTKEKVAHDLPPKLEQTIFCEMEEKQRKLYEELRDHYRQSLLGMIESGGINRAKMQILEALLRLRQIACHPGLLDEQKITEPSAKIDTFIPQLLEVLDNGQKVLVFSQFTSLLAIVKDRLDLQGVNYEYLDGRTRDRQARVERFQNDPECKLFLISLKAGGLGLNLTAAEYVFLLDPWWNPAVEAQAIDRAHRIGQTRRVFAYRLITKDTVEEKVLQLQETKRELADAIINADNSLIRTLERKDLELLLS